MEAKGFRTDEIKEGSLIRFTRYSIARGKRFDRLFRVTEVYRRSFETGHVTLIGFRVNKRTGQTIAGPDVIGVTVNQFVKIEEN